MTASACRPGADAPVGIGHLSCQSQRGLVAVELTEALPVPNSSQPRNHAQVKLISHCSSPAGLAQRADLDGRGPQPSLLQIKCSPDMHHAALMKGRSCWSGSKTRCRLTECGGPGVASTLRRPFPGGIGSGSCHSLQQPRVSLVVQL